MLNEKISHCDALQSNLLRRILCLQWKVLSRCLVSSWNITNCCRYMNDWIWFHYFSVLTNIKWFGCKDIDRIHFCISMLYVCMYKAVICDMCNIKVQNDELEPGFEPGIFSLQVKCVATAPHQLRVIFSKKLGYKIYYTIHLSWKYMPHTKNYNRWPSLPFYNKLHL